MIRLLHWSSLVFAVPSNKLQAFDVSGVSEYTVASKNYGQKRYFLYWYVSHYRKYGFLSYLKLPCIPRPREHQMSVAEWIILMTDDRYRLPTNMSPWQSQSRSPAKQAFLRMTVATWIRNFTIFAFVDGFVCYLATSPGKTKNKSKTI